MNQNIFACLLAFFWIGPFVSVAEATHYRGGQISHQVLGRLGGTSAKKDWWVVKATLLIYQSRSSHCGLPKDGRGVCCLSTISCLDKTNPRILGVGGDFLWGAGGEPHPTLTPANKQISSGFKTLEMKVVDEDILLNSLGLEFTAYRIYPPPTSTTTAQWGGCCRLKTVLPTGEAGASFQLKTNIKFGKPNFSPDFQSGYVLNGCTKYKFKFNLNVLDRDKDTVVVKIFSLGGQDALKKGLTFAPQGFLEWTNPKPGNWVIKIEATDANGASVFRDILINIVPASSCANQPPTITVLPTMLTTKIGVQVCTTVKGEDPDTSQKLRFSILPALSNVALTPTNALSANRSNPYSFKYCWTPQPADENLTKNIQFSAFDSGTPQLSAQNSFMVTVSKGTKPTIVLNPVSLNKVVDAGKVIVWTATASDAETSISRFTQTGPSFCKSVKKPSDKLEITCSPGFSDGGRSYLVKLVAIDSDGVPKTGTLTVLLKVKAINRKPTFAAITKKTILYGMPLSFVVKATDPDGDTLTYTMTGLPVGATLGPTTGAFAWTPTSADVKTHKAVISAKDGKGGIGEIKVSIIVTNAPPVITMMTLPTSGFVGDKIEFVAKATDANPGDTLIWSLIQNPNHAKMNPSTGKFSWIPQVANAGKVVPLEMKVCDALGLCDARSFSVSIQQKCFFDADCIPSRICEADASKTFRICVLPRCSDPSTPCTSSDQMCSQGQCKTNPCASKTCAPNEFCQISDGKCVSVCPVCSVGQICLKGRCVKDLCSSVTCAKGERCEAGVCTKDRCLNRSNNCRYKRTCFAGRCAENPCDAVKCGTNEICVRGTCHQLPPKPEPPIVEPRIEPNPEPAFEPLPEPEPNFEPRPEPEPLPGPEPSFEPLPEPDASSADEPTIPEPLLEEIPEPISEPILDVFVFGDISMTGGCYCNGGTSSFPRIVLLLWLLLVVFLVKRGKTETT